MGGYSNVNTRCTETYNGSTWATQASFTFDRRDLGAAGTTNAAIIFGGFTENTGVLTNPINELYNGTTWATGANLITGRRFYSSAVGTQNSALAVGGYAPPIARRCTEEWNGIAWAAGTATINITSNSASTGAQSKAIAFGSSAGLACTELYNIQDASTSTAIVSTIQIGDKLSGRDQSQPGEIFYNPTTNEFNFVIKGGTGVWSAGNALITARTSHDGAGTQTAALAIGGYTSPTNVTMTCVEAFNGYTWSSTGALITTRMQLSSTGKQNAALAMGGATAPTYTPLTCTEKFNGSTWATSTALPYTSRIGSAAGTQNAAVFLSGYTANPAGPAATYEFNGSNWCTGGSLSTARYAAGAAGTQNSAVAISGRTAPGQLTCTEAYNGTAWSVCAGVTTGRSYGGYAGTQNAALVAGGSNPGASKCTEEFNGTIWTVANPLLTANTQLAGAGTQSSGIIFGGYPTLACTELYNQNGTQTVTLDVQSLSQQFSRFKNICGVGY